MDVGIGLPAMIPGAKPEEILDWARRADAAGFSTLSVLDRLVYDSYEPLVTLAAAAAVTERIRLATTILIATYRADVAVLAKQVASVNRLSGGRLVLGMSAGQRADDYVANQTQLVGRGVRLDEMVDRMRRIWSGTEPGLANPIGPTDSAPRLVFGGHSNAAVRRAARHGWGWVSGGSSPRGFEAVLSAAREVWRKDGISAEPRKLAITYFGLGDNADRDVERFLIDYYAFVGLEWAVKAIAGTASNPAAVREVVRRYREAGCDELLLVPCSADPRQVDLVAEAAL